MQWLKSFMASIVSDVSDNSSVPSGFTLSQNYPNPFNPTTFIRYGLPRSSRVRLTIYNILGTKIRTLVDATQAAGEHTVAWDAKDNYGDTVASGIYFYRLETENSLLSQNMMLLR